jgi:HK97 family phage portal protein
MGIDFLRAMVVTNGQIIETISSRLRKELDDPYTQHPVVYACVKLILDNVSQVPFRIYTSDDKANGRERFLEQRLRFENGDYVARDPSRNDEGITVIDSGPIVELFDRPNPVQSGKQFWESVVLFLSYVGECDIVNTERDNIASLPEWLVPGPPQYFTPKPTNAMVPVYWEYRYPGKQAKNLQTWELIRPRLVNPNDLRRGLSPLDPAQITLNMDWQSRLYNEAFFENDATLGGFFLAERPMKENKRKDWIKGFHKEHAGSVNAFKWSLLEGIKEVHPLTATPKDVQFSKLSAMSKEEIAMIFRVPLLLLSRPNTSNYGTARQEVKSFWSSTIIPIIRHLEDIFWAELFQYVEDGRYWGAFDLSKVDALQEDFQSKLDQAKTLFDMRVPFNTVNERLQLGFEAIPGGDTALVPMNMIPVEMAVGGSALQTDEQQQIGPTILSPERIKAEQMYTDYEKLRLKYTGQFQSKYKRYLFQYRKFVLDNVDKYLRADPMTELILGSQEEWDKRLMAATESVYVDSMLASGALTAGQIGTAPFLTATSPEVLAALQGRANMLSGVNDFMFDNMRLSIAEGMAQGETVNQIQRRVKDVMNFQSARSLTVARTEMGTATSMARDAEFREGGVEYTSWQTAGPFAVPAPRATHSHAESLGAIPYGKVFGMTGCRYPLDPQGPAKEVINCRCASIPEVRD